ncbi:FliI/YscN family ATPase [Novosphingobium beihaiensis]|uniref:FliI/YscN family ATPase n=1 Tax=Novosphingobium beihaiensis TaxID=2930389 RepID=A0ABT0BPM2_9SPHN|nr:FliI/YscN family ATPase [Novosphingobium beihaiensis]MCJ2186988.1 FliI/YscN family ATPase [Novosphingobium beihaiensis]
MYHPFLNAVRNWHPLEYCGTVTRIASGLVDADGPMACVGDYCEIEGRNGTRDVLCEVVSVEPGRIRLSPLHPVSGIGLGARVRQNDRHVGIPVGDDFAGRAVNALGEAVDAGPAISADRYAMRDSGAVAMLDRYVHREQLATGVKAIDAFIPLATGQRIGIFAASGVGKTSLVEQLSSQIECDHTILCLIGERGREAEGFWSNGLSSEVRSRTTLVAATSDESASLRIRAIEQALCLAEFWRGKGRRVVLFVDSITRLALALREIGLASGEPPTVRGYTPNIFAAMPRIVERCGADRNGGAITAIFTVLAETDDLDDPIVELMKSLLDGHIMLSRDLAERGVFPAIDISASISRLASAILSPAGQCRAESVRRILADFNEVRPMLDSGLYKAGVNHEIDQAVRLYPQIRDVLRQPMNENWSLPRTADRIDEVLAGVRRL